MKTEIVQVLGTVSLTHETNPKTQEVTVLSVYEPFYAKKDGADFGPGQTVSIEEKDFAGRGDRSTYDIVGVRGIDVEVDTKANSETIRVFFTAQKIEVRTLEGVESFWVRLRDILFGRRRLYPTKPLGLIVPSRLRVVVSTLPNEKDGRSGYSG